MQELKIQGYGLKKMCRVCLMQDKVLADLFCVSIALNGLIVNALEVCAPVRVKKNDGYPNFICKECYIELKTSYEFAIKVLKSENILENYLKKLRGQLGQNKHNSSNEDECEDAIANNSTAAISKKALRSHNSYLTEDTSRTIITKAKDALPAVVTETNESPTNVIETNSTSSTINGETVENANENNYSTGEYPTTSTDVALPDIKEEIQEPVETDSDLTDFQSEYNSKDQHDETLDSIGKFECDEQPNSVEELVLPDSQAQFIADVSEIRLKEEFHDSSMHEEEKYGSEHSVHFENYKCRACEARFLDEETLNEHKCVHIRKRLFKCRHCGKCFFLRKQLKHHLISWHSRKPTTKKKSNSCNRCKKSFVSKFLLESHEITHSNIQPYKCEICGSLFKRKHNLTSHLRIHYTDIETEQPSNENGEYNRDIVGNGELAWHRKCSVCAKMFPTRSNLIRHFRIHTGEKPYTCEKCKRSFSDRSNLKQHKCRIVYRCGQCTMVFFEENALTEHLVTHSIKEQLRCHYCQKLLSTDHSLKRHIRIHTGEKPYSCEKCERSFTDPSNLKAHKCQKIYRCEQCKKFFFKEDLFTKHALTHSIKKEFRCNYCQKLLSTDHSLKRHIRIHTREKQYCCEKCKRSFSDLLNFKNHKCQTVYRCLQCTMVFFKESALTEHTLTHPIKEQLRCNYCQKLLSTKQSFERHVRLHTGEKPFGCSVCGKKFSDQTSCKRHNEKCLLLSKTTNYCVLCYQTFSQKEELDEHICVPISQCKFCLQYFNEDLLPQHRRVCSTRFRNLVLLRTNKQKENRNFNNHKKQFNHGRLHGDNKPIQCEVCNKCFSTKQTLRLHMRIHTGEKPYKCTICDERFRLMKTLKRHKCEKT